MPTLETHQSQRFTKLLLIGDSGTGKTGSLASLVKSGYKLRILDFDNGLDSLVQHVKKGSPDKLSSVEFRTLRDRKKASPAGPVLDGPARAFVDGLGMFDRWKYGDTDLGKPATWGEGTILVLDSLTFFSDAAEDWAESITPGGRGGKDGRMIIYNAQKAIESTLGLLTSESFETNVIVTAHIRYTDMPDGSKKGYPVSAGSALGPTIPRFFNNAALMESVGGARTLKTVSNAFIDLKNPSAFKMAPSIPIENALADFFNNVRN